MTPTEQNDREARFFEELSAEEKRRIITALSMGKLSPEEKEQLKSACEQSRLTEDEKRQLSRAFQLSNLTDEQRKALLERRKKALERETAAPAQPQEPPVQTAEEETTPEAQKPAEPEAAEPTETARDNTVFRDEEREKRIAENAVRKPDGRNGAKKPEKQKPPEPRKRPEDAEEDEEEEDHTALTSLLKGIIYIVSVLIVSVFASYAIISVGNDVFAFVKDDTVMTVGITEDMTVKDVANLLYENGLIKYPTVYELFVRIKGYSTTYLVGEYEVSPMMNYKTLNRTFTYTESDRQQVVITIPEGYTTDQIIALFLSYGIGTEEGFVDVINNYPFDEFRFLDELPATLDAERRYRLEGYLFPDTYYFFEDNTEVEVIYKLLQNTDRKIADAYYDRAAQLGMTMDEVITLASMIQAEGTTLTDYENISSVFHNRLNHPNEFPKLQSDATLQYILDKRKTALTASDLLIESKYNTYLTNGLPPSAICNPSLDAIACALYPAETDYYYFLADKNGNTYFSKTLAEHEALKAEYID